MIRYMVIYTHVAQPEVIPTVSIVDCNIHSKEEAYAEAEWYAVQNQVEKANVTVVEYRE